MVMSLFTTNLFAQQLEEVRGVQTRVVKYEAPNDAKNRYKMDYLHGFEFTNENKYAVWVEAELVTQGFSVGNSDIRGGTRDTKNFTLKAGETYVWKCGEKMVWANYSYDDYYDRYFVKYKAYKAK